MIAPLMLTVLILGQSLNVPRAPCGKDHHHPTASPGTGAGAVPRGWAVAAAAPNIGESFTLKAIDPAIVRLAAPFDTSRGGGIATATIRVPRNGVYAVAIDRKAWIDVATGATLETSVAHRHGAAGSGIAKIVDFRLTAGEHVLGVTGIAGDRVKVLVTPVDGA